MKGTIEGNTDVIKALKTIKNKDEFFGKLKNINKSVNKNKVWISLASDGKVLVNNQYSVSVSRIYRMGEEGRNKLFAKYGPANVTTKNAPTRIYSSYAVASSANISITELAYSIRPEEILKITAFIIHLSKADQDVIIELLSHISERLHDGFLLLCAELIISLVPAELDFIETIFPDWKKHVLLFVFDYLKSKVGDDENDNAFMSGLKSFIRDGRIDKRTLLKLKEKLMEFFSKQKEKKGSRNKSFNVDFSKYLRSFETLRVGQWLSVGPHTILIKQITLDKLEMSLQKYSQEKCDMFMELCFKIISALTKDEVIRLNAINPDEDIIMRVSVFLLVKFEKYTLEKSIVETNMVSLAKTELLEWCGRQRVKRQKKCKKCNGITYHE